MEQPQLIDLLMRETMRPRSVITAGLDRSPAALRDTLLRARRFVLDESMSAFLADISTVPFATARARSPALIDSLRHGARLPHPVTWIEYDQIANRKRMMQLETKSISGGLLDMQDQSPRLGWLLEEHPQVPTAIKLSYFAEMDGNRMLVAPVPFSFVWQTTDDPLPWHADHRAARLSIGITEYDSKQVGVVFHHPVTREVSQQVIEQRHNAPDTFWTTHYMIIESAGIMRHAIAFLATLNDIPIASREVRPSKGYIARGSHHKFLAHSVITLNVPERKQRLALAQKLVALARRRAHSVRGHWRLYQRGEGLCFASEHEWGPQDDKGHASCARCSAWRTWIDEHERGDASLGYVTHEYRVQHPALP